MTKLLLRNLQISKVLQAPKFPTPKKMIKCRKDDTAWRKRENHSRGSSPLDCDLQENDLGYFSFDSLDWNFDFCFARSPGIHRFDFVCPRPLFSFCHFFGFPPLD